MHRADSFGTICYYKSEKTNINAIKRKYYVEFTYVMPNKIHRPVRAISIALIMSTREPNSKRKTIFKRKNASFISAADAPLSFVHFSFIVISTVHRIDIHATAYIRILKIYTPCNVPNTVIIQCNTVAILSPVTDRTN